MSLLYIKLVVDIVFKNFRSRKRNLIIDSSEDEEDVDENPVNNSSAEISNDDEFNVATQKFLVRKYVSVSNFYSQMLLTPFSKKFEKFNKNSAF